MTVSPLQKLAENAAALAREAKDLQAVHERDLAEAREENARLRAELEQVRASKAAALQAVVARIGRNPDTSRAMEEAFQEGRLAGLAEAADMAETYAFRKINGGPVQLGMDRSMIIVTQFWLSEHIRARAEERPEPKREPLDPAP